jgi:regulator of protease activity HflC (stomatin/prohibitin superfamily)
MIVPQSLDVTGAEFQIDITIGDITHQFPAKKLSELTPKWETNKKYTYTINKGGEVRVGVNANLTEQNNKPLLENVKIVFGRYTAENLISKRDILADEILTLMKTDLESYGITVISIAIEDIDFTDSFTNAIEAKQVATQEKLRAQTVQEQANMEAEAQAERQRIAAQAEADVAKIQADAEAYATTTKATAEAEANKKINASLTQELIDYVQANNWDGKLPGTFMGNSSGALPILDITE